MTLEKINLGDAWSDKSLLEFYQTNRNSYAGLYPSEKLFIDRILKNDSSYIDLGCALGGFSKVLKEKLSNYKYTGIDVSEKMINQALAINESSHKFIHCPQGIADSNLKITSDYVICLGFLHLHQEWRKTLQWAFEHCKKGLVFDLRETHSKTIEDISSSSFNTHFNDSKKEEFLLPYNIINCGESSEILNNFLTPNCKTYQYGYLQEARNNNGRKVWMKTYFIEKL